ncbi:DUF523 domain-containing protein [Thermodesulfobacteriota bacterium]
MTKSLPFNLRVEKPYTNGNTPILISGCLLGLSCRYDGRDSRCKDILGIASSVTIIPFCPEQLGGLPTPRPPAKILGGDGLDVLWGKASVINSNGENVTGAFIKGAEESLMLARLTGAWIALLKDRSPSCGLFTAYCDKTDELGQGVTAALFKTTGIRILEIRKGENFPAPELMALLEGVYGRLPTHIFK